MLVPGPRRSRPLHLPGVPEKGNVAAKSLVANKLPRMEVQHAAAPPPSPSTNYPTCFGGATVV